MLVVACAGAITTIGLMVPRHRHNGDYHSFKSATTSNHMRAEDSDDSDSALLSPFGKDLSSAVLRMAAIETLDDQLELLRPHDVRRSVNGELNITLHVGAKHFTSGPISFWTRAYEQSIPAPLWSVQPGDIINLELINELEANVQGTWTPNTYHNPNSTNVHLHGMHVDPTGIADNILREAGPGETLVSRIVVPKNHPRGLYHYHPHYHGSIFLQLAGGMSGPILVEDDHATLPDECKHIKKHVLVLQEFRFDGGLGSDVREANRAARSKVNHRPQYTVKTILDAQVRSLYPKIHLPTKRTSIPLSKSLRLQLSAGKHKKKSTTPDLSRFFAVNGQFMPKIEVQPRENVLLRLLNAGGSAALELAIPGCTLRQIAADGIYFSTPPRTTEVLLLSPGARADVVIHCEPNDPLAGIAGESLRPLQSVKHRTLDFFVGPTSDVYQGVLAFVRVSGASRDMPMVTTTPPSPELYATSDLRVLPPAEEAQIKPFPFVFSMDSTRILKDGFPYKNYFINHAMFNMSSMRKMPLGMVQEWVVINERDEPTHDGRSGMLTTKNHPFHIHTNAFQIVAVSHGEGVDYKVGDWRDVIAVPTPGNVTIRFRPVDFRGAIVAHCHIAGHSDAGMVARVDIV
jgi:FtsP/CotA-like multicopper oxidase with cupredoxin domain